MDQQLVRELVHTIFVSNNRTSFDLWWKENLVKHWNVSKYYKLILGKIDLKINVIRNGLEKYMGLSVNNKLRFIQSFHFLSFSLDSLVKNLVKDTFRYLSQEFDVKKHTWIFRKIGRRTFRKIWPYIKINCMSERLIFQKFESADFRYDNSFFKL